MKRVHVLVEKRSQILRRGHTPRVLPAPGASFEVKEIALPQGGSKRQTDVRVECKTSKHFINTRRQGTHEQ